MPVRRGRRGDADRDDAAPGAQLALLRPRRRPRPALRLSRTRSVRTARGPSLQSGQAADRPVCEGDRGRRRLVPRRERAPVRAQRGRERRPRARRRGRCRRGAEVGRDRRCLLLGGRSPAADPVRRHGDLRDSRQGVHDAPPGRSRGPPRHLRGPRIRSRRSPTCTISASPRSSCCPSTTSPTRRFSPSAACAITGATARSGTSLLTPSTPPPDAAASKCGSSRAWSRHFTEPASR